MPAVIETQDGIFLHAGFSDDKIKLIDPREGEVYFDVDELSSELDSYRIITFARRPDSATKRFGLSYFYPFLRKYSNALDACFCRFNIYQYIWLGAASYYSANYR